MAYFFLNVFLELPNIYFKAKEQARKEKRINTMINNAVKRQNLLNSLNRNQQQR